MKIIEFILYPIFYLITAFKLMQRKKMHEISKRNAWSLFYSKHKEWVDSWYREKGLNSKPPIYYDQKLEKYIMLNRKQLRKLKKVTKK